MFKKWNINVKNNNFYKRVLQQGSLGLGESYVDCWWECDNIDMLVDILLWTNIESKVPLNVKDMIRVALTRLINLQPPSRAWIVGKEHCDLGNDLFSEMQDPFMQNSCGYWKDAETLEEAYPELSRIIQKIYEAFPLHVYLLSLCLCRCFQRKKYPGMAGGIRQRNHRRALCRQMSISSYHKR